MTRRPASRTGLSRMVVASAGLALVDREGLDALTFRKLASDLGVGVMTLYTHVPSREALVADVAAVLLNEIDTREQSGESWGDTIRRVAYSHRAMALRHPRAYPIVVNTPFDRPPMLDHSANVLRLHDSQQLPEGALFRFLSIISSFVTGYLMMETQAILRQDVPKPDLFAQVPHPLAEAITGTIVEGAFEKDLEVIIAGLQSLALG